MWYYFVKFKNGVAKLYYQFKADLFGHEVNEHGEYIVYGQPQSSYHQVFMPPASTDLRYYSIEGDTTPFAKRKRIITQSDIPLYRTAVYPFICTETGRTPLNHGIHEDPWWPKSVFADSPPHEAQKPEWDIVNTDDPISTRKNNDGMKDGKLHPDKNRNGGLFHRLFYFQRHNSLADEMNEDTSEDASDPYRDFLIKNAGMMDKDGFIIMAPIELVQRPMPQYTFAPCSGRNCVRCYLASMGIHMQQQCHEKRRPDDHVTDAFLPMDTELYIVDPRRKASLSPPCALSPSFWSEFEQMQAIYQPASTHLQSEEEKMTDVHWKHTENFKTPGTNNDTIMIISPRTGTELRICTSSRAMTTAITTTTSEAATTAERGWQPSSAGCHLAGVFRPADGLRRSSDGDMEDFLDMPSPGSIPISTRENEVQESDVPIDDKKSKHAFHARSLEPEIESDEDLHPNMAPCDAIEFHSAMDHDGSVYSYSSDMDLLTLHDILHMPPNSGTPVCLSKSEVYRQRYLQCSNSAINHNATLFVECLQEKNGLGTFRYYEDYFQTRAQDGDSAPSMNHAPPENWEDLVLIKQQQEKNLDDTVIYFPSREEIMLQCQRLILEETLRLAMESIKDRNQHALTHDDTLYDEQEVPFEHQNLEILPVEVDPEIAKGQIHAGAVYQPSQIYPLTKQEEKQQKMYRKKRKRPIMALNAGDHLDSTIDRSSYYHHPHGCDIRKTKCTCGDSLWCTTNTVCLEHPMNQVKPGEMTPQNPSRRRTRTSHQHYHIEYREDDAMNDHNGMDNNRRDGHVHRNSCSLRRICRRLFCCFQREA